MKKNRTLLTACSSLAAVFAAAVALDYTGYSLFNRADGSNALCRLDRSCRSMTAAETALARETFGNTIDYKQVKIFTRQPFLWPRSPKTVARMWNSNIYVLSDTLKTPDFSTADALTKAAYLHELTHVWQYANDPKFLHAGFFSLLMHDFDYESLYGYDIGDHKYLSAFNFEQQAQIIEEHYVLRAQFHEKTGHLTMNRPADFPREFNRWARGQCKLLDQYTMVISSSLPQPMESRCAMYRPYERPNLDAEKPDIP